MVLVLTFAVFISVILHFLSLVYDAPPLPRISLSTLLSFRAAPIMAAYLLHQTISYPLTSTCWLDLVKIPTGNASICLIATLINSVCPLGSTRYLSLCLIRLLGFLGFVITAKQIKVSYRYIFIYICITYIILHILHILFYVILQYIILCYIILYYIYYILFYIILYYIILCFIILYYIILHYLI